MVGKTVGNAIRWLTNGKWDPNRTARDAYIDYISRQGNIGEDRDLIQQIFDKEEPGWGGDAAKITLTRGDIGRHRDNFERVDSSLELVNELKRVNDWNKYLTDKYGKADPELTEYAIKLSLLIKQCQNLVIGFVMPNIDDNKNLVIDKPYLVDMGKGGGINLVKTTLPGAEE